MDRRALALRDYILKNAVWEKENFNPKTWLKSNQHVNNFTEFILRKDLSEDGGYDKNEMCKYRLLKMK